MAVGNNLPRRHCTSTAPLCHCAWTRIQNAHAHGCRTEHAYAWMASLETHARREEACYATRDAISRTVTAARRAIATREVPARGPWCACTWDRRGPAVVARRIANAGARPP